MGVRTDVDSTKTQSSNNVMVTVNVSDKGGGGSSAFRADVRAYVLEPKKLKILEKTVDPTSGSGMTVKVNVAKGTVEWLNALVPKESRDFEFDVECLGGGSSKVKATAYRKDEGLEHHDHEQVHCS